MILDYYNVLDLYIVVFITLAARSDTAFTPNIMRDIYST